MMRSARERAERQSFFLSTTGTDPSNWQLRWSWTRSSGGGGGGGGGGGKGEEGGGGGGGGGGAVDSGVSTTTAAQWEGRFKSNPRKGADAGRELTIKLCATTAAAGADDGVSFVAALVATMAKEGRHTLSPSQLKSALQKNVRLSRPAEAVRCAASMVLCASSSSSSTSSSSSASSSSGGAGLAGGSGSGGSVVEGQYIEGMTQLVRRYVQL